MTAACNVCLVCRVMSVTDEQLEILYADVIVNLESQTWRLCDTAVLYVANVT